MGDASLAALVSRCNGFAEVREEGVFIFHEGNVRNKAPSAIM